MVVDKFLPKKYTEKVTRGKVQHRAPSNIALVKYWGKKDFQLPANPSLSFTLTNSYTDTSVEFLPRTDFNASFQIDFYFEESLEIARKVGFKSVKILDGGEFRDFEI